jgi:outer membrane protein OmpA-like peptidoglycan-associated protein
MITLVAIVGAAACGPSVAPRELEDAREAFHKAKEGPAGKYALAQLEIAKQKLQDAETSFRDGDEEQAKDLAYIAERHAQLATANGALAEAKKEKEDALTAVQKARKARLSAAERALEKGEAELEAERKKRLQAEKEAAEARRRAAAALASLEELAKVKEEARGVVITLSGAVLFASGKYELLPIARSKLDEVAKALKDQGYQKIIVEGHTDSRGGDSANLVLSERRAEAVRSHLVSRGIEASKITAVGLGESRPIASNATSDGRANNRRVEIVVTPE